MVRQGPLARCVCYLYLLLQSLRGNCSPPKIIWAFWHDHKNLPKSVQLAHASWAKFAPEYIINFLDQNTWRKHLAVGEIGRCGAGRTFSEWLRLRLLAKHGGVWLDASIILTTSINYLISSTANISGVDIHNGWNFETSFIASVPQDRTISLWLQQYTKICDMSEDEYKEWLIKYKADGFELLNGQYSDCDWANKSWVHGLLESIIHLGSALANLFIRYTKVYVHPCGQEFWMWYLKINTSLNAVLGTIGQSPKLLFQLNGIYTQATEKTLMLVPHLQGYEDTRVSLFLLSNESQGIDLHAMRGVKLSKGDRESLDAFSTCEEGSIICRVEQLTDTNFFQRVSGTAEEIPYTKEL